MEADALLLLIRIKLSDGRLSDVDIPRISGGAGNGERCDACDTPPACDGATAGHAHVARTDRRHGRPRILRDAPGDDRSHRGAPHDTLTAQDTRPASRGADPDRY